MARKFAQLHCDIWEDRDFLALSPEARFTFVACFAQKIVNYCGVLVYSPARMARATGYKPVQVNKAIAELDAAGFVLHDDETGEILVRSFVVNNNVCAQPQLRKAMERCFGEILSDRLRRAVVDGLPSTYTGTLRAAFGQPADHPDGEAAPRPRITGPVVATTSDVIGNPDHPDTLPVDKFDGQTPGGWMAAKEARAALKPVPGERTDADRTEAGFIDAGFPAVTA